MVHNQTFYPTVKDVRQLMDGRCYFLKGAMTNKIVWRSWLNRHTDKYDDMAVCSIWAEVVTRGEGFSQTVHPALGIYVRGL